MVMAIAPRVGPPNQGGGTKIDPLIGEVIGGVSGLPGVPAPMRFAGQVLGGLISSGALNPPPPMTTVPTRDPYRSLPGYVNPLNPNYQGYSQNPVIPGINPMNYVVH
tara:strand:+ start:2084 stop:2404 length:321 start_codon:yes stop_codon:yes gene_type:complete